MMRQVLMAFLIGSGRQRQLHFSLLDTARFSNFSAPLDSEYCVLVMSAPIQCMPGSRRAAVAYSGRLRACCPPAVVWELRKEAGLRTQPVMLHCGGIHGKHKEEYIRSHGFWRGDAWDGTGAASHIALLSEHFKFRLPSP